MNKFLVCKLSIASGISSTWPNVFHWTLGFFHVNTPVKNYFKLDVFVECTKDLFFFTKIFVVIKILFFLVLFKWHAGDCI